ncbi:family 43 glycosylhydrolase [Paenibacillus sp.]|uniref:family 43 glycosylhydrolase n=1 Tax=Paenibacillus sp. TaxID=58172 RepID=UPI002D56D014|nr:family 43 glycosylhydrolase [Paenibacillus sp.]HZG87984.1 family 43 glycosylhydrolase [Paenibacillus sp.]
MKPTKTKQVYNPFLPLNEYIPDGEPHVFGDRIYLFGSHDKEGGDEYCELGDYVGYSAPVTDLSDWRYEGVIYTAKQDPGATEKSKLYAPDVVQGNDGRYYLYYNLSGDVGFHSPISVAVCDTPAGAYEYYGYVRNPDGSPFKRHILHDPALINDNGTIRLYYGYSLSSKLAKASGHESAQAQQHEAQPAAFSQESMVSALMMVFHKSREEIESEPDGIMGANVVTLADDMLTVTSGPVRIIPGEFTAQGTSFEGHAFYEASSIRKIGELYYFIYSSQQSHELCYAVSKYPDQGFTYGGTIISNGDVGYSGRKEEDRLNMTANDHGSIENINGQWYVFHHRHTHSSTFSRQACAEPIEILPDGSIPQVEMTSCGLNGGPLIAKGEYSAVIACNVANGAMPHITNRRIDSDIPFITHGEGQRYITNVKENTRIGFKYFAFEGPTVLKVVTRGNGNGSFIVSTDEKDIGVIPLSSSETWCDSSAVIDVRGTAGLYFTYSGSGVFEFISFAFDQLK